MLEVHRTGVNPLLVDLPQDPQGALAFLQELEKQAWALLMVATQAGKTIGVTANGLTNLGSLNTYVLAMFTDPASATVPLALYTRQMFYSFPLQRMYVQFPLVEGTTAYADLYRSVGFQQEGIMKKHQAIGGKRQDVVVFGLLRDDFDAWWAAHDPQLSL